MTIFSDIDNNGYMSMKPVIRNPRLIYKNKINHTYQIFILSVLTNRSILLCHPSARLNHFQNSLQLYKWCESCGFSRMQKPYKVFFLRGALTFVAVYKLLILLPSTSHFHITGYSHFYVMLVTNVYPKHGTCFSSIR